MFLSGIANTKVAVNQLVEKQQSSRRRPIRCAPCNMSQRKYQKKEALKAKLIAKRRAEIEAKILKARVQSLKKKEENK